MLERGVIIHRNYAAQIRDFSGLRYGNITPTDIDGLIEYHNRCWVFVETKYQGSELPFGQKLALERLCNDIEKNPAIAFVTEHSSSGDIDFAKTKVREYYWRSKWRTPSHPDLTLDTAITKFFEVHGY